MFAGNLLLRFYFTFVQQKLFTNTNEFWVLTEYKLLEIWKAKIPLMVAFCTNGRAEGLTGHNICYPQNAEMIR